MPYRQLLRQAQLLTATTSYFAFFRIEEGEAAFIFAGKEKHQVNDGDAVIVPAGTYHNVINASKEKKLKLYTLYSPPNHPDKTVHKTKAEAERAEAQKHH